MSLIPSTSNKAQTEYLGPRKNYSKERILLGLRIGALLCQLNCVVCFAWALTEHEKGIAYIDGLGSSWSSINLGTSAYAFLWSAIFLVVISFKCKVPPPVTITFDLLAFLSQIITVSFFLNEFVEYQHGSYSDDSEESNRLYGVECWALSTMLLGLTLNLILMICASIDCHAQRKVQKREHRHSMKASTSHDEC